MKPNIKRILWIFLVGGGLIGMGLGLYMFNKPHKNIHKAKAAYKLKASELVSEFKHNEQASNEKYLGQVIQVTGEIIHVSNNANGSVSVYLEDEMFGVTGTIDQETVMEMEDYISDLKKGQILTLKGRCDGMLSDVRLSKCIILID